mgnify:CR=1 FL=1
MRYPAPGDVALARRVVRLLGEDRALPVTGFDLSSLSMRSVVFG